LARWELTHCRCFPLVKGCEGKVMEYVGGGFVIAGARCLPLEVWVQGERAPGQVTTSFGAGGRCASNET
jgi:hypothetical protein